jgi:hypothetical protein
MDALFYIMGCYERPEFHDIMEVANEYVCLNVVFGRPDIGM